MFRCFIFSVKLLGTQLFHSIIENKKRSKGFPKKQLIIFVKKFNSIVKSTLKLIETEICSVSFLRIATVAMNA